MKSYVAFISYRHLPLDSAVAKRLHRMIEHYRIPRELRKNGVRRLGRVFRDEDELPLSKDLGESIHYALDHSEYLISICSPDYPHSKWCMEELDSFIATHGRDHVLTVLASGTPAESFPPRLLSYLDENGMAHTVEPLAANIATQNKSRSLKRLKKERLRLIAAMLGCSYDSLYQRERRYRQRRILAAAAAALAVAAVFIGTLVNKNAQIQARYEEAQANLRQAQLNESVARTENARLDLSMGRPASAVRNLLKALPASEGQPYDRAAEGELASALGVYADDGFRFISNIQQTSEIDSWLLSGDGELVFTWDSFGMLRAWKAASGELLWQKNLSGATLKDDAMVWCEHPKGVICPDQNGHVYLISAEDGSELWRLSPDNAAKNVLIRADAGEAVLLSVDTFSGRLYMRTASLETGGLLREEQIQTSLPSGIVLDSFFLSPGSRYAAAVCYTRGASGSWVVLLTDLDAFETREIPLMSGSLLNSSADCAFTPDGRLILSSGCVSGTTLTLTLRQVDPASGEILSDVRTETQTGGSTLPVYCLACSSEYALVIHDRTVYEFALADGALLRQAAVSGRVLTVAKSALYEEANTFLCVFEHGLVSYLADVTLYSDLHRVHFECGFSLTKARIDPRNETLTLLPKGRENELLLMRRVSAAGESLGSAALTGYALLSPSGEKLLMRNNTFTRLAVLSAADDRILWGTDVEQKGFLLSPESGAAFSADEETLFCGEYTVRLSDGAVSELPFSGSVQRTAVSFVPGLGKAVTAVLSSGRVSATVSDGVSGEQGTIAGTRETVSYFHIFLEEEDQGRITIPDEYRISSGADSGIFRLDGCGLLLASGRPDSSLLAYDVSEGAWRTFPAGETVSLAASGSVKKITAFVDRDTLRLYDFVSGEALWEAPLPFPAELASGLWFAPDDSLLLVTYGETRAALFRVSDGVLLNDLAFSTSVRSFPVSLQRDPEGRLYICNAASSLPDSDSLILDAETGELLGRILGLKFVNFRTGKLYSTDTETGYASLYPLYTLEELAALAEEQY